MRKCLMYILLIIFVVISIFSYFRYESVMSDFSIYKDIKERELDILLTDKRTLENELEKSNVEVAEYKRKVEALEERVEFLKDGNTSLASDLRSLRDEFETSNDVSFSYDYYMADEIVGYLHNIISSVPEIDTAILENFIIPKNLSIGDEVSGLIVTNIDLSTTTEPSGSYETQNLYDFEWIEFKGELTVTGEVYYDDVEYGTYMIRTSMLDVVPHRSWHQIDGISIFLFDEESSSITDEVISQFSVLGISDGDTVTVVLKDFILAYAYGKPIGNQASLVEVYVE